MKMRPITPLVAATILAQFVAAASASDPAQLSNEGAAGALKVQVQLEVGGDLLTGPREADAERLPIDARANARYQQSARGADATSAQRRYESATLTIADRLAAEFKDKQETFVAQLDEGALRVGSTERSLQRQEIDLAELPADPLTLASLLPKEPKNVGDEWTLGAAVIGPLMNLQSVTLCDTSAVLTDVTASHAKFRFAGTVHGVSAGAATEIDLSGVVLVDRKASLVSRLNLGLTEKRAIGPATPGLDVNAKLSVTCTPIDEAVAVAELPSAGVPVSYLLKVAGPSNAWKTEASRGWRVTTRTSNTISLTLVDGQRRVADVLLRNLPIDGPGSRPTKADFSAEAQSAIETAGGTLLGGYEGNTRSGLQTYAACGHGQEQGTPVVWRHYLIQPEGEGRAISAVATIYEPTDVANAASPEQALLDRLVIAGAEAKIASPATNNRR